ncbi:MAG TPA: hypothetical protein RMF84_13750 [Polyangiaceae bacterium LLY-WYZ-14_1]|nr:hypothetical protein [Polyangiaceae bacterium LLY-WYZ-14_1]
MYAPSLSAEILRLPAQGDETGTGMFAGSGLQIRSSFSHSLVDVWRGRTLEDIAQASCAELVAADQLRQALEGAVEGARRRAVAARLAVLETALPRLEAVTERAAAQRERGLITLLEADAIAGRADDLRRAILRQRAELAALGPPPSGDQLDGPVDPAAFARWLHRLRQAAADGARGEARLRRLRAWDLRLRGGVIPGQPADWYGGVELRLNLGAVFQGAAEADAEAARQAAMEQRRDGLVLRVAELERRLGATARILAEERELVAMERARTARRLTALDDHPELPSAVGQRDAAELRLIELDAEDAYLAALVAAYRPFVPPASATAASASTGISPSQPTSRHDHRR